MRSGERLGVLLVALGTHRFPHSAREVHLFAKVPQGAAIIVVGVVQLGEFAKRIRRPTPLARNRDSFGELKFSSSQPTLILRVDPVREGAADIAVLFLFVVIVQIL